MLPQLQTLLRAPAVRESIVACAHILLGCLLAAIGIVFFISPYGIVPGGITGLGIVLHALFPSTQIGTYALMVQIPLLALCVKVLGGKLGGRTLVAVLGFPLMINGLSALVYPDAASLQALDPSKILGGRLDLSDDLIICALAGGTLLGIGTALVVRQHASTGGSDIVAMIISKYTKIRFSRCMMFVDGLVILSGLLVIGIGLGGGDSHAPSSKQSLLLSFYSLLTVIVVSRSVALGLSGAKDNKLVHIICHANDEKVLRQWIIETLNRTATRTQSYGVYTDAEKPLLLLLVHDKELPSVTEGIRQLAPDSFVIITDAYEAYGLRWKDLPEPTALQFG